MPNILIALVIVLTLLVIALLVFLITASSAARRDISAQSASIGMLQQQLEGMKGSQDNFRTALEKNLQSGQQDVGKQLRSSQDVLAKLHTQIGQLKGSSDQMLQLGTDVRSLQDILKNPKLRGQLGEMSLEKILSEILPASSFALQHHFKNGKIVDALVNMPDYSVPVDAKFPLPAFEAMIKAETEDAQATLRRQFQRDIISHIDKIAENYINPDEGTLDFALMYIPAENVYYETIVKYPTDKIDILSYALEKKIIPVSPNLLYAYLMTIVMGLHGLQIEKQASEIYRNLRKLVRSFSDFGGKWNVLGKHLKNAASQYDEGQTKLDKFTMQLDHIQSDSDKS
ncbi:MAG TPA: DNA recombination protein RmuC [Phycisphaerales bacterium]|nr:DNA recombination protein RmuC [Phycisphaerales bacterium]